jgi:hypothetical protein
VNYRFGIEDVFECIPRLPFEGYSVRIDAQPLRPFARYIGFLESATLIVGSTAGEDELRLRIAPCEISEGDAFVAA